MAGKLKKLKRKNECVLKIFVILAVFAVFFIAGCNSESGDKKSSSSTAYIGGTSGLSMKFMEGSPPSEVYDKGLFPFDVSLKIENKGEYTVDRNKAKVRILGIDPAEFGNPVMEKSPDEDLAGTKLGPEAELISGTVSYLTFSDFNYMGSAGVRQQLPIRATMCYEYGAESQSKLCVRENVLSTTETVCKINEVKKSESSGSPIQISSFQESAAGKDKLTFSFTVEHKGTGAIYTIDKECDDSPTNKNKVWVSVEVRDMQAGVSCTGLEGSAGGSEGYIRLEDGKRTVRCTLSTSGVKGDFEKAIKVSAKFNYKESIDQILLVKPSVS